MQPSQEKEAQANPASTTSNSDFSTFGNQISGHSCMLKPSANSNTILKPFKRNEVDFYEYITKQENCPLKKFIPTYYGLHTLPKSQLEKITQELARESSSSDESEDSKPKVAETVENDTKTQAKYIQRTFSELESKEEWMNKLYGRRFDQENNCFFEIQDLTANITAPCVLDLKVGIVIHHHTGRLERQDSKPDNSTLPSLKFRIGGLQVKNPNTSTEYFKNKSWGRKVKLDDIQSALALFFYDGHKIRRNLIKYFISHLQEVREAFSKSNGFRFCCVSLLLVYDGTIDDEKLADEKFAQEFLKDKTNIGLIDFAKTVFGSEIQEPDKECLQGVENFIANLLYIQENLDVQPLV